MADPSLLTLPAATAAIAPPQSQPPSMQAATKPAAAASTAPAKSKTTTTRVFLRVKRRRPSPTTDAAAATHTANNNNVDDNANGGGPDRICLALASTPVPTEGSKKKRRRKMEKKEEMALIQRLDSAVSFRSSTTTNNDTFNEKEDDGNEADFVCHTPQRSGSAGYDPMGDDEQQQPRTPPPSSPKNRSRTSSNYSNSNMNMNSNANDGDDEDATPAPPTKPKRTVIFRKITDLQKRILNDNDNNEPSTPMMDDPLVQLQSSTDSPVRPFPVDAGDVKATTPRATLNVDDNGIINNGNNLDTTQKNTPPHAKWSSKGEEKSKWLRIVDVMLKEEDEVDVNSDNDNNDGVSSISSEAMNVTVNGKGEITGSGQRVRRMRPRPVDIAADNLDGKMEGAAEENGGNVNGSNGGRKKRRKLGWVVEQSQTMLESDFWNSSPFQNATASVAGNKNAANASSSSNDNKNNNDVADGNVNTVKASSDKQDNNSSSSSNNNNNNQSLSPEITRLIEYSLASLSQMPGGTISPHLVFLKSDPRLQGLFVEGTPRAKTMINHVLEGSESFYSQDSSSKGRTVLHLAALWGDLIGVKRALEMGADPTIYDARGNTPLGLARKAVANENYMSEDGESMRAMSAEVVQALMDAEKKAVDAKNIKDNGDEYYYEVYCLETETDENGSVVNSVAAKVSASSSGSAEGKKTDDGQQGGGKSQFLRTKDNAGSTINTDSIPDLERSSVLSDDDDFSGNINREGCALIELQKGFGYWNDRGELILEASGSNNAKASGTDDNDKSSKGDDEKFVQRFYHDGTMDDSDNDDEDEHDSNDEGYGGNDYPDDASFGCDSDYDDYCDADAAMYGNCHGSDDDDSVDNWKMDFRNRSVAKNELTPSALFGVDGCDDGDYAFGLGEMDEEDE